MSRPYIRRSRAGRWRASYGRRCRCTSHPRWLGWRPSTQRSAAADWSGRPRCTARPPCRPAGCSTALPCCRWHPGRGSHRPHPGRSRRQCRPHRTGRWARPPPGSRRQGPPAARPPKRQPPRNVAGCNDQSSTSAPLTPATTRSCRPDPLGASHRDQDPSTAQPRPGLGGSASRLSRHGDGQGFGQVPSPQSTRACVGRCRGASRPASCSRRRCGRRCTRPCREICCGSSRCGFRWRTGLRPCGAGPGTAPRLIAQPQ